MDSAIAATLERVLLDACASLFGSVGLRVTGGFDARDETPQEHDIAASVGFASAEMKGALVMTTQRGLVARAWPKELGRLPTDHEICDWAGELGNQLLGRIKTQLVPFGIAMAQGTPTVIVGWHLHRVPGTVTFARRLIYRVETGSFIIHFDAELTEGFALVSKGGAVDHVREGDVRLF